MGKDIIYREDAIEALKGREDILHDAYTVVAIIRNIPSADRPQGEWIAVSAFDAFGGDEATWMAHGDPTAFHYCSECKEQTLIDEFGEEILSNFCPHCGAPMKGVDDD